MRLKEVTLTNFRSYKGVHTFAPRLGTTFLLGTNSDDGYSSNGGGKTSLLSAIAWALYGELATGASKDAVIHYGEPEVAVEVKFEGLIVRRSKKRSKSEVLEYFADELGGWIREDLSETQDKLDRYLGVSKELFYNAFWMDNASKSVQFLFKRPAERLQILQDLLGEGFFSQAKKASTVRRQDAEKEIEVLNAAIDQATSQVGFVQRRIYDSEVTLASLEKQEERNAADRQKKIDSLQEEIATASVMFDKAVARMTLLKETNVFNIDDIVRNCAILEAQIAQQSSIISSAINLPNVDVCPTCNRALDSADTDAVSARRKTTFKEISRLQDLLQAEQEKKEKAKKEKRALDNAIMDANTYRATVKPLKKQLEDLMKDTSSSNRLAIDKTRQSIQKDKDWLESLRKDVEMKKTKKFDLAQLIPSYKFWEEGFGSKGIQNLLLDDVRGLLDQFTRNYLSHFSGEVLKVVYPKSDKGFEILVSYRDQETPVSNLSRGEVGRANMAVLLALRKMLLYMRKSKVDFIVLDDAISDLDESGTQSIVELSDVLSKEVGHVFLTLPQHVPTIKQDQIVQVIKKNGVSQVVCAS